MRVASTCMILAGALVAIPCSQTFAASLGYGVQALPPTKSRYVDDANAAGRMMIADGRGGAYVAIRQNSTVWLARLDSNGRRAIDWPEDLVLLPGPFDTSQYYCCWSQPNLFAADDGVLAVVKTPGPPGASRIDAAGVLMPGWSEPNSVGRYFYRSTWSASEGDAASDGAGGAFMVAAFSPTTHSYTTREIGVTRIDPDGEFRYPWAEGFARVLSRRGGVFGRTAIVPDASGGAFVVWDDSTGSGMRRISLVRIDHNSVPAVGWTLPGIVICETIGDGSGWPATLEPDGTGGVFVAWSEGPPSAELIRLQRITRDGALAPGWPAAGLRLDDGSGGCLHPQIVADGAGGAYVAWYQSFLQLRLTHVTGAGTIAGGAWGAGGIRPLQATGNVFGGSASLIPDGAGGAIVATVFWDDAFTRAHVRVGRLLAGGSLAPGWGPEGLASEWLGSGRLVGQRPLTVVSSGRVLVAWGDNENGQQAASLRTTVISLDGTTPATVSPGPVARFAEVQPQPSRGPVRAMLALPRAGEARVEVHDLMGRRVRALPTRVVDSPAVVDVTWDGLDDRGLRARPGVYLLAARGSALGAERATVHVVIAR